MLDDNDRLYELISVMCDTVELAFDDSLSISAHSCSENPKWISCDWLAVTRPELKI